MKIAKLPYEIPYLKIIKRYIKGLLSLGTVSDSNYGIFINMFIYDTLLCELKAFLGNLCS